MIWVRYLSNWDHPLETNIPCKPNSLTIYDSCNNTHSTLVSGNYVSLQCNIALLSPHLSRVLKQLEFNIIAFTALIQVAAIPAPPVFANPLKRRLAFCIALIMLAASTAKVA
ncbi:hypothetical protein PSEUDO9AG_40035 [Pseudomonas sp. 9Ag]|nr:hypothetical protein PSEUDO9AG_40035 [Pseudomonas sp. 9Ag]